MASEALQALQEAAANWRRRQSIELPLQTHARRLLAWLESRPDLEEPISFERVDLATPLPAGVRVLLPGQEAPWFTRLRLHSPMQQDWLPRQPREGIHITRQNPCALIWAEDHATRRHHCGALALVQAAAGADAEALVLILNRMGLPAAAAMVEKLADGIDVPQGKAPRSLLLYEMVPRRYPSPRRLLLAAFADRPRELEWIEELCDGAEDWDSGPEALPVPRGEALLPGQSPRAPEWIAKL
jgi:hypothetical protein